MAILDIFKNKKESKQPAKKQRASKKVEKSAVPAQVPASEPKKAVVTRRAGDKQKRSIATVYNIISEPHISEKATNSSALNQYVFEVFAETNKKNIKEAVEIIYNVDVLSVNIINIPRKKRRMGKTQGFRKAYKKAIVKITEGQKIEII